MVTGLLRSDPSTVVTATTTTSTTTPLAEWIAPAEIVVPPSIVVPTQVTIEPGLVIVDYDIQSMAIGEEAAVRPIEWSLLTTGDAVTASIEPAATRVAFDVGFGFDPTTIVGLRLDRYVMRSPIQAGFTPSPTDFSAHEIAPGVTAALDIVQLQTTGAIVRVQLAATQPGATADLAAEGLGPGWVTASSNFGGGGQWTLSFDGADLPDPLPLVIRGILWIPLDSDLISTLERVPRV